MAIASLVVSLELLMTGLGFQVEPGTVQVYVQLGCLYGLCKLWGARKRIYPYALRASFYALYLVVWLLTPAFAAYNKTKCLMLGCCYPEERRPVDCVEEVLQRSSDTSGGMGKTFIAIMICQQVEFA